MRRIATAAALVALVASACGDGPGSGPPKVVTPADRLLTSVEVDGVYQAGVDIAAGVYTTEDRGCEALTASTGDVDIEAEDLDVDSILAMSTRVGDLQRIVINQGEFFIRLHCGTWQREDDDKPKSADPTTLAGGCEVLVGGDDVVHQVLAFLQKPTSAQDSSVAHELQDKLMAVVGARTKSLWGPAGQLVDALDDPSGFVNADGKLTTVVTRSAAEIRENCRRS